MDERRWPVSDREVKPWWFHALNWASVACLVLMMLVFLGAWASIL